MNPQIRILLVEDLPADAELIARELKKGEINFNMLVVNSKEAFTAALTDFVPDIILSDHSMPFFNSNEALRIVRQANLPIPFILITSSMSDEFAVEVMKEGADDYIIKDRLKRLPSAVNNSVEKYRLTAEKNDEGLKATKIMKQLNDRLQLATKSAGIGIWDWNIEHDILEWDAGMYRLYNTNEFEFGSVYEAWLKRVHPEDLKRVNNEMQMAIQGEKKYDTEFRIIASDDDVRTLRATGIIEKNEAGNPVRMVGVNWEITERKLAALEREKIIDDLLQRNKDLEQFAYIVSHNLRAPIANIIGASNALGDPDISIEDTKTLTKGINESVTRLDNVVIDINHILELKANKNNSKENVRFSELVEEVKLSFSDMLSRDDIAIIYDFSAADEFFTVKPYLYSIFYNLISNSIKYRQPQHACLIKIKSRKANKILELTFKDNGIGIDIEKWGDQVFGLYKRFHPEIHGKGIGLFTVKTQVESLGGKIDVESSVNEGSVFKIEFNDL